jgi:hypothetical protein
MALVSALSTFGTHLAGPKRSSLVNRKANRPLSRAASTPAAAAADEGVQLGTAKLPANIDEATFSSSLFQWANTLTTSVGLGCHSRCQIGYIDPYWVSSI